MKIYKSKMQKGIKGYCTECKKQKNSVYMGRCFSCRKKWGIEQKRVKQLNIQGKFFTGIYVAERIDTLDK